QRGGRSRPGGRGLLVGAGARRHALLRCGTGWRHGWLARGGLGARGGRAGRGQRRTRGGRHRSRLGRGTRRGGRSGPRSLRGLVRALVRGHGGNRWPEGGGAVGGLVRMRCDGRLRILSWGGERSRERPVPAACFVTNSVFSPAQNRSRSREPDQGGETVLSERRTFGRTHRQGEETGER